MPNGNKHKNIWNDIQNKMDTKTFWTVFIPILGLVFGLMSFVWTNVNANQAQIQRNEVMIEGVSTQIENISKHQQRIENKIDRLINRR